MNKVTFELEGREYKIPNKLTIGDYVKIFKVKDLFEDDYFSAKLISIVTGAEMSKLLEADRGKVGYVFEHIYKILPLETPGFVDRFELDGVHYGFIPSWKKMSFGEFADLDTLMTKKPDELLDYLHIITAILYRPITSSKSKHKFEIEKYNQDTLEERAELFKNKLDVEVALGAQFFFTQFARIYSNYTPISLKMWMKISWIQLSVVWKMRKWIWKKIVLRKDLDGLSFSTEFAKMILQDIQKLLIKQS
jgi:hypothetical protein